MAEKFVNERNISFLLYEVFDALSLIKHTGRWQGTMALTELHAGSSLSDITTSKNFFEIFFGTEYTCRDRLMFYVV